MLAGPVNLRKIEPESNSNATGYKIHNSFYKLINVMFFIRMFNCAAFLQILSTEGNFRW